MTSIYQEIFDELQWYADWSKLSYQDYEHLFYCRHLGLLTPEPHPSVDNDDGHFQCCWPVLVRAPKEYNISGWCPKLGGSYPYLYIYKDGTWIQWPACYCSKNDNFHWCGTQL